MANISVPLSRIFLWGFHRYCFKQKSEAKIPPESKYAPPYKDFPGILFLTLALNENLPVPPCYALIPLVVFLAHIFNI